MTQQRLARWNLLKDCFNSVVTLQDLQKFITPIVLLCAVENPDERLVTVNTIKVPEGVDPVALITHAMTTYNLEIAGGLGPSAGKVR